MNGLSISAEDIQNVNRRLNLDLYCDGNYLYLSRQRRRGDVLVPEVGDYRINFTQKRCDLHVSVVGEQRGENIVPYEGKILLCREGHHTAHNMIQDEKSSGSGMMWVCRVISGLMIGGGIAQLCRS